ncbi:protein RarD [compost metagenome]
MSFVVIWIAILLFRRKKLLQDIDYFKQVDRSTKRIIVVQLFGAAILLTLNWYTYIYAVNHVSLKSAAFAYMVCPLITAFGGF